MENIKIIRDEVNKLLKDEKSGHGMDHINRVIRITIDIATKENANLNIATAIALLHDVDDYKIFDKDNAINLINAKNILEKTNFNYDEKKQIIDSIKTIGYSKRLEGIIPKNLEAKIVSDADMLDALGAIGILRTLQYNISNNKKIFDKNIFPNLNMNSETYKYNKEGTAINHLFEKILKLKDLMLTKSGKNEALKRHNFVINFLKEYFYEENAEEWLDYLDSYLMTAENNLYKAKGKKRKY